MILFLDLTLINTHATHAFYDSMLHELTKVIESTADLLCTTTVKSLQSLHTKGMRIFSIMTHGLSSQGAAFSGEDGLECR
jgi:hypothetical protein